MGARWLRHRWDLLGVLAVALFALSLATDFLHGPTQAPGARLDDPTAVIQLGDEWLGLHRGEQRVGLLHLRKSARPDGGYRYQSETRLRFAALGAAQSLDLDVTADLSASLVLEAFTFSVDAGPATVRGEGVVDGLTVKLALDLAGARTERTLTLEAPPVLSGSVGPILSRLGAEPGTRHTLSVFDPLTQRLQPVEVEIIGPDTLVIMGQAVATTRVRQRVAGLVLEGWMNARGEMLRQELGLGLVAVRETEAEARWGLGQARAGGGAGSDLMAATLVAAPGLPADLAERAGLWLDFEGLDPSRFDLEDRRQRLEDGGLRITREPLGTGLPLPVAVPAPSAPDADAGTGAETGAQTGAETGGGAEAQAGDQAELRQALLPEPLVESDHPAVVAAAREALAGATDTVTAAQSLVKYLKRRVRQRLVPGVPSALATLRSGTGDCNEHSALFAALGRAAGVPTRIVVGLVHRDGSFGYHAWNEVLTVEGWLSVDPTWHQIPVDVGHVALLRGGLGEQVRLLPLLGQLRLRGARGI